MPFTTLGLVPALVRAATDAGYFMPTPVQSAAIPAVLRGQDVLGLAQTGSGKTAAFSLPLLQRWAAAPRHRSRRTVHTLVLVPTRELAAQVGETLRLLGQHLHERPKIAVLYGGVSVNPQMMALRGGADIVVATPGRLLDLVEHNALKLPSVAALVLDEADRLLDLGFRCGALPRRAEPGQAHPGGGRFQSQPRAGGGGDRPGRARHRHRATAGGGELRSAALGHRLRAPHRPHRPRR
jgi:superfamily II DNA/RNA helicase